MQVTCPACLATNRVSKERIAERPKCGRCHSEILAPSPLPVDRAALSKFVDNTDLPVVVDFWAEWCGPCRAMAPELEEAARRRTDVRFLKVDTEREAKAALEHRIKSIPTLALYSGGKEVARISGAMPWRELLGWVDRSLALVPASAER